MIKEMFTKKQEVWKTLAWYYVISYAIGIVVYGGTRIWCKLCRAVKKKSVLKVLKFYLEWYKALARKQIAIIKKRIHFRKLERTLHVE